MLGQITLYDINEALPRALPLLLRHGKPVTAASVANARPTIEWPGLFVTEYIRPERCVLFDAVRDANPLFHYLEALWLIAGRQDVEFLAHVLPRMAEYSDDGETFHGAYGYRLRHWNDEWSNDQIEEAIRILREHPNSRQVVMSIWNPDFDLGTTTKDMPCNDMIMLKVRDAKLNITMCNRSNDAVWGCYGANAVQFSMLLMYLAARLNYGVGTYHQVSDSFHVYEDNPYWQKFKEAYTRDPEVFIAAVAPMRSHYQGMTVGNLFHDSYIGQLDNEIRRFFEAAEERIARRPTDIVLEDAFQTKAVRNAVCIWNTLARHRAGDSEAARQWAWKIPSEDWRLGVDMWLARRRKA